MGNKTSHSVGGRLTKEDIARLQRRFQRLAGADGNVSIAQFQSMVELGGNPFVGRIFQLFDENKDNKLNLKEFTKALEFFGTLDQIEEQYKFAFSIYDLDGDGYIGGEDLYSTLAVLMGKTYSDAQLEQVVLNTMQEFDSDGDNKLSLSEFKQLLSNTDLQHKFTLHM